MSSRGFVGESRSFTGFPAPQLFLFVVFPTISNFSMVYVSLGLWSQGENNGHAEAAS
jgi:hypothetical protein